MDDVFRALADPSRRRLLDGLNARGGQSLRELCSGLAMARAIGMQGLERVGQTEHGHGDQEHER